MAPLRDLGKQIIRKIAVRVDQGYASASLDVLSQQMKQERGFSSASCPDHIGMPETLSRALPHLRLLPSMRIPAKENVVAG